MARLLITTQGMTPAEIVLAPGCNRLGREGENEILIPHPSISRRHCEVWLMDEAVMLRDLGSRNGTFVAGERITEAQLEEGQSLRVGDIEMVLAEARGRISVPDLPLPPPPKEAQFMADGTPCCLRHDGVAAEVQCGKCQHVFCNTCVRALRVAGGMPRRFCPDCGGPCEPLGPKDDGNRRPGWLSKIVDAFTKPTVRRR